MSSRLSMKTPEGIKCDQCGMIFTSEGTLQKHKEKFCIGLPDSGNNREDLTLGDGLSIDLPEHLIDEQTPNDNNTPMPMMMTGGNSTQRGTAQSQLQAQPSFYIGSPQPKAQSPAPDLQPKPIPRKQSATPIVRTPAAAATRTPAKTPVKTTPVNTNIKSVNDKQKAIDDLQSFKAKRSLEQSVKDMEDLIVRDTMRDKKLINSLNNSSANLLSNSIVVQHDPYKALLKEYSELKQKEKLVLKDIYDLNQTDKSAADLRALLNESVDFKNLNNNSDDKENIKSPINTQQMLPNLATTNTNNNNMMLSDQNQRYLKQIQSKTLELERERKEIQQKLESLKADDNNQVAISSRASINRILSELRDQERINEAALDMLKKRILTNSVQNSHTNSPTVRAAYIPSSSQQFTPNLQLKRSSLANNSFTKQSSLQQFQSSTYMSKPYSMLDDSLSSDDIRQMRMNYLTNGGHDSSVLGRFTEMEYLSRYGSSSNMHQNTNRYPAATTDISYRANLTDRSAIETRIKELHRLIDNNSTNYDANNYVNYSYPSNTTTTKINKINKNNINSPYDELDSLDQPLYNDVTRDLDDKIQKVETENKRLQVELEFLQEKYRNLNYGSAFGNDASNELKRYDYDQNLERVKFMLNKYDKYQELTLPPINTGRRSIYDDVPNLVIEQKNNVGLNNNPTFNATSYPYSRIEQAPQFQHAQQYQQQHQQHQPPAKIPRLPSLRAAPYDPIGGFVMFIDFVSNLDASVACSRVITCLHHPKSGLGEPSILPLVNCETYMEGGRQSTVALISTKQPVPRCPPQQALTILIELQLATKEANESKLRSIAWTKIPLFDFKNRLLSGRWKMPLKTLPIKSDANLAHFNSYQPFNEVEFFYRLVNARDSDEQTNAPISPAYADQYHTPPQHDYESQYNQQDSSNQSSAVNRYKSSGKQHQPTIVQPTPRQQQQKILKNTNASLLQEQKKQEQKNKDTNKIDAKRATINKSNLSTNSNPTLVNNKNKKDSASSSTTTKANNTGAKNSPLKARIRSNETLNNTTSPKKLVSNAKN